MVNGARAHYFFGGFMKRFIIFVLVFLSISAFCNAGFAQTQSDNISFIKMLDAKWERALQVSDLDFMSDLLSEEFVWIHNHASKRIKGSDPEVSPRITEENQ